MNPGLCFKQIRMTYNGKTTVADISDTVSGIRPSGPDLLTDCIKTVSWVSLEWS